METGNVIIVIISILVFAIPFIWMSRSGKKFKNDIVKSLEIYANDLNFKLDNWVAEADFALGLDEQNRVAFFIKKTENQGLEMSHVLLSKIKVCKLNIQTRSVKTERGKENVIQLLELVFYPKTKNGEMVSFVVFDEQDNKLLADELSVAKEWEDVFNMRIK